MNNVEHYCAKERFNSHSTPLSLSGCHGAKPPKKLSYIPKNISSNLSEIQLIDTLERTEKAVIICFKTMRARIGYIGGITYTTQVTPETSRAHS